MSDEQPVSTASSTEAQCAALREQNERLRGENERLRQKIEEERVLRQSWELDAKGGGGVALETLAVRGKIEALDQRADVLAVHDELQHLRQKCAVYAEALEESRGYFFEMKRLYAELELLQQKPGASPREASGASPPPPPSTDAGEALGTDNAHVNPPA